ncbi:hypothetical protein NDU88_005158 [Pleurodeles waltl]|uniref:Uncharacterized protein n=1 Tax=Pleurodeles waltl TaxID=8319 RepID=A0AAV7NQQ0_PLEWA|nr:hypothetical protein NDU88_005158 [Pleurodeles waltl]
MSSVSLDARSSQPQSTCRNPTRIPGNAPRPSLPEHTPSLPPRSPTAALRLLSCPRTLFHALKIEKNTGQEEKETAAQGRKLKGKRKEIKIEGIKCYVYFELKELERSRRKQQRTVKGF